MILEERKEYCFFLVLPFFLLLFVTLRFQEVVVFYSSSFLFLFFRLTDSLLLIFYISNYFSSFFLYIQVQTIAGKTGQKTKWIISFLWDYLGKWFLFIILKLKLTLFWHFLKSVHLFLLCWPISMLLIFRLLRLFWPFLSGCSYKSKQI